MNITKNKKGFTLIELMVVVVIIGILATIAVPQYQKFQKKSRQSEAKAGLADLYTAQQVFKLQHKTYYNNLWATGYEPVGVMHYAAYIITETGVTTPPGFNTSTLQKGALNTTVQICGTSFADGISQDCMRLPESIPDASDIPNLFDHRATPTTFLAGAATKSDDFYDVWTIDHRKTFVNVIDGVLN